MAHPQSTHFASPQACFLPKPTYRRRQATQLSPVSRLPSPVSNPISVPISISISEIKLPFPTYNIPRKHLSVLRGILLFGLHSIIKFGTEMLLIISPNSS